LKKNIQTLVTRQGFQQKSKQTFSKKIKVGSLFSNKAVKAEPSMAEGLCTDGYFSVLTFNVWFDKREKKTRAEYLFDIVKEHEPTFLCFQEATVGFQTFLKEDSWMMENYQFDSINATNWYFVMVGVKKSEIGDAKLDFHEDTSLPTNMGRTLKTLRLNLFGRPLAISTIHLESLNNEKLRREQIQKIGKLQSRDENVILCGDFNFCSHRNFFPGGPLENRMLEEFIPKYEDTWVTLHADELGYTFDTSVNPWIFREVRPERMRYDRMMLKSKIYEVETIDIVGNGDSKGSSEDLGLDPKVPSDHFGLIAKFKFKSNDAN